MRLHSLSAIALAAGVASAPSVTSAAAAAAAAPAAQAPAAHTISFKAGDGANRGTARLSAGPSGVLMRVELTGLTPGWHAIHFHAKGDCSRRGLPGRRWPHQPRPAKPHGLLNPEGPDIGDLPNVYAGADGTVRAEAFSDPGVAERPGRRPGLMDADGSAIVVHASPDDGTDPAHRRRRRARRLRGGEVRRLRPSRRRSAVSKVRTRPRPLCGQSATPTSPGRALRSARQGALSASRGDP